LVGAYDYNASTSDITSIPPGIIHGPFYGYNGGYYIADTLKLGFGYWVNTSGGQIILPSPTFKGGTKLFEKLNSNCGRIIITDNTGKSYSLYSTIDEVDLNFYQLPPLPPSGVFDIRFGSGRFVEDLSSGDHSILMQGLEYPVMIKSEKLNLNIEDESGFRVNGILKANEEFIISDNSIDKLLISQEIIPTQFSLEQNFPNPFNPSTSIKFSIPEKCFVTIIIYNSIGEEIKNLVSDEYEPGNYTINFNASEMVSGVYIYKMIASKNGAKNSSENFVQSKKMLLLK